MPSGVATIVTMATIVTIITVVTIVTAVTMATVVRYKELHSDKAAITGLAFNKEVNLFVATEIAVYCYKKVCDVIM